MRAERAGTTARWRTTRTINPDHPFVPFARRPLAEPLDRPIRIKNEWSVRRTNEKEHRRHPPTTNSNSTNAFLPPFAYSCHVATTTPDRLHGPDRICYNAHIANRRRIRRANTLLTRCEPLHPDHALLSQRIKKPPPDPTRPLVAALIAQSVAIS
uniref:Uncharacterized protein n=1 Tax=Plectus sambesii TaxID=2011161 RepID=A0A914WHK9_9BILA